MLKFYVGVLACLWVVSCVDFEHKALNLAMEGNVKESIPFFQAHLKNSPQSEGTWCNYAFAMSKYAKAAKNEKKMGQGFREAIMSYDIAWMIAPKQVHCSIGYNLTRNWVRDIYPRMCIDGVCDTGESYLDIAMSKLRNGVNDREALEELIDDFCEKGDRLSFKVKHRKGRVTTRSIRRILVSFMICGVVTLESLYSKEFIEEISVSLEPMMVEYIDKVAVDESVIDNMNSGERGHYRYEVNLPLRLPFINSSLIAHDILMQIIKSMLSERIEIDTFSYVVSRPNASHQHWHSDVTDPFLSFNSDSYGISPPYGLVLLIPVSNITYEKGPTEISLGSHLIYEKRDKLKKIIVNQGDCVLFDIGIVHRGTRNRSTFNRAMLYISYVRDWFMDRVNFRDIQSISFDEMESNQIRKLLIRRDSMNYINQLHNRIVELNGTFEDLISRKYASSIPQTFRA